MQGRELVQFVTDFTWYLRNLMLVQTADNLEDVIRYVHRQSGESEGRGFHASMDQIIRYIHISPNCPDRSAMRRRSVSW